MEPFAAVKKLMGQHFDAVVVDCDNEQNATLLFKSARNSTSNQTSLAVAVVEGQAGVAKAFRIGANLVLTKPINIEQAKGTLRVARGLLRKSEPTKSATTTAVPVAPTSVAPVKPVAPPKPDVSKTIVEAKPAPPAPLSAPRPPVAPVAKPVTPQAWPAPVASSKPVEPDDDLLEIGGDDSGVTPAVALESPAPSRLVTPVAPTEKLPVPATAAQVQTPVVAKPATGSGAASAPAPARETPGSAVIEKTPKKEAAEDLFEKPTESAQPASSGVVGSVPSFTFGGSDATDESSGGSKKIFVGVAAVAIVAAGLYFGWTHFHGSAEQPGSTQPAVTAAPVPTPSPAKPGTSLPKPTATATTPASVSPTEVTPAPKKQQSELDVTDEEANSTSAAVPSKASPSASAPVSKTSAPEKPEPAPLFVKGGKAPSAESKAMADAPAPSAIGMAAPGTAAPPPNLVTGDAHPMRPVLQTLNVSQGVSQGLLYKKVAPSYPTNALRMKIEGTVELLATISKTGDITNIKVVSGDSQLTRSATDAVKQWKYKPYLLNGEPVEITTQVTVKFKLPH